MRKQILKFFKEKRADFGYKELIALLIVIIFFTLVLKIFFPYISDTLLPLITDRISDMFDYFS